MGIQKQENICSNFWMVKLDYHHEQETFGKGLIDFIILVLEETFLVKERNIADISNKVCKECFLLM